MKITGSHYKIEELKNKVIQAVSTLIHNDSDMILKGVNERTITSRLGYYLQDLFPDRHVDCEYNLNKDDNSLRKTWSQIHEDDLKSVFKDIKNLKLELNDIVKTERKIKELSKKINSYFYPDIIVHRRNSNDFNEIVIEAKKNHNSTELDRKKINYLLGINRTNNNFNYRLGCILKVIVGNQDNSKRIEIYFMQKENIDLDNPDQKFEFKN